LPIALPARLSLKAGLARFAAVLDSRAVHWMTNDMDQGLCMTRTVRVAAEADPSTLVRVLMAFQHLNVVPRSVSAETSTTDMIYIEIEVTGLTDERVALIAAKLGQLTTVTNAYWNK
jgi:acetolactate synthase regulatory subunit